MTKFWQNIKKIHSITITKIVIGSRKNVYKYTKIICSINYCFKRNHLKILHSKLLLSSN